MAKKSTTRKPAEGNTKAAPTAEGQGRAKPKANKAQRRKAPPKAPAAKPARTKEPKGAKQAAAIELMSRPQGATTKELIEATGWQAHSVRGFISGAIKKKLGWKVESSREDGVTTYRIAGGRVA